MRTYSLFIRSATSIYSLRQATSPADGLSPSRTGHGTPRRHRARFGDGQKTRHPTYPVKRRPGLTPQSTPRRYCARAESGSTRAILGDRKWFRSEVTSPLPPPVAKAQPKPALSVAPEQQREGYDAGSGHRKWAGVGPVPRPVDNQQTNIVWCVASARRFHRLVG